PRSGLARRPGCGRGQGVLPHVLEAPPWDRLFVTNRTLPGASSRWTARFGSRMNGDGHDTETDGDHRGSGTGRARRGGGARPATDPGRRAGTGRRGRRVVVLALRP